MKSESASIKLKEIYYAIARKYDRKHSAVTRSISYAISQAEHIKEYLSLRKFEATFNGKVIAPLDLKLKLNYTDKE